MYRCTDKLASIKSRPPNERLIMDFNVPGITPSIITIIYYMQYGNSISICGWLLSMGIHTSTENTLWYDRQRYSPKNRMRFKLGGNETLYWYTHGN